jgi:bifunctional non-homologous end joining protein LigD
MSKSGTGKMPNGARLKPMPRKVDVMKATLVDEPFSRDGWIFENKWDGERAIVIIDKGKLKIFSRNDKEITRSYPELHDLPEHVHAERSILDGEIVILSKSGKAEFALLQPRFGLTNKIKLAAQTKVGRAIYEVFDILYLDGYSLAEVPLIERKRLLKSILHSGKSVKFTKHVVREGKPFFAGVKKAHGEGMVAKDMQSSYVPRRSTSWLKVKTTMRQEVVIAGYTVPRGSREHFGALQLGLYDHGKFLSIGQVGTGFSRATLKDMFHQMQSLKTKTYPYDADPETNEEIQWIKPKLVCEVKFSEWTKDRKLRHPSFEGLRNDKSPKECTFEKPKHLAELVTRKRTIKERSKEEITHG